MAYRIDLLVITFNRLGLTRQTFDALFSTNLGVPWADIRLTIIDNKSQPQTIRYLKALQVSHADKIHKIIFNKKNAKVVPTMVQFLRLGKAPFVAKLDNDTLVRPNHFKSLMDALNAFPDLQIAGACIVPTQNPLKVKGYQVAVKKGIQVAYARNVGGIFLARRGIFSTNGVPSGDSLYGWTGYQNSLVNQWRHAKKKHPVGFVKSCAIVHLDTRRETNKPVTTYDLWEK